MALERQTIERKDFRIGNRGYEPEEVDAHLAQIASEVDELRRSARRRTDTLASTASEQVRLIVEAAEQSATQIQRQAEEEAAEIRGEASEEADRTRAQAAEQARDHVEKVSGATGAMLQRLEAMEGELSALVESLRTGANRLNADMHLLEGNLSELQQAAAPRRRFEREPVVGESPSAPHAPEPVVVTPPAPRPSAAAGSSTPPHGDELAPAPEPHDAAWELEDGHGMAAPAPAPALAEADLGDGGIGAADDTEGARLIALNMALNGTPRAETDRYLSENFQLSDRAALLDEVYASVAD